MVSFPHLEPLPPFVYSPFLVQVFLFVASLNLRVQHCASKSDQSKLGLVDLLFSKSCKLSIIYYYFNRVLPSLVFVCSVQKLFSKQLWSTYCVIHTVIGSRQMRKKEKRSILCPWRADKLVQTCKWWRDKEVSAMTNLCIKGCGVQGNWGTHPAWKIENGFREEMILRVAF